MGQLDNLPDNSPLGNSNSSTSGLKIVTQELENQLQTLIVQLSHEVKQLQAEKNQLAEEIAQLRQQTRSSENFPTSSSSSPQLQQIPVEQLANALAEKLQSLIPNTNQPLPNYTSEYQEQAQRLIASLDSVVRLTINTLQRDLESYENALSQQLARMHTLEQRGEAIVETLVQRLQQTNLSTSAPRSEAPPEPVREVIREPVRESRPEPVREPAPNYRSTQAPPTPPVTTPSSKPAGSKVTQGITLAFLSAVVLSLFNVALKIMLKSPTPRTIFGIFEQPGLISPGFGNSLLILFLRLVVVMSIMPVLATVLYPQVWQDIKRFIQSRDVPQMLKVVGSGFFLFLSQVFIYLAIGNIPTGIAITIFFIYPIVTVLASWGLFGDRPTLLRVAAMAVIGGGGILALPAGGVQGNFSVGVSAAIAAGVTFAGYVLLTQMGTKKLHPIPFTLIAFASIFVFCGLSLMLPIPEAWSVSVEPAARGGLLIGGVILGILTLASYLLNNYAIRYAGAALASIIGTSGPALTALFGLLIISEQLKSQQWLGLALVTVGVLGMSLERMMPKKAVPQKSGKR